jgi:hypothetical protein
MVIAVLILSSIFYCPSHRSVTKPDVFPPLAAMTTREHDPTL